MPNERHSEDSLFLNNDYSIDDFISMKRTDFDHGFGSKSSDRIKSDDKLRDEVSLALLQSPQLDASEVEVSVLDGVVTLSGTVTGRLMKKEAEACLDPIIGIVAVRNDIELG